MTQSSATQRGNQQADAQFKTDCSHPGRWTITFSNPPINMFVPTTIVELRALMTDLQADPSVKVVVLPLISKNQEVLGAFCLYYAEARSANETDLRVIEGAGHITVIAIEGERSQQAFRTAFEEIQNSEATLRTDHRHDPDARVV